MNYISEMQRCPLGALKGDDGYYFWLNTDFLFGDYSIPKWAFHCRDEKTGVDEVILWGAYQDLNAYNPELEESEQDGDEIWDEIDQIIESELGYCPLYDVN